MKKITKEKKSKGIRTFFKAPPLLKNPYVKKKPKSGNYRIKEKNNPIDLD